MDNLSKILGGLLIIALIYIVFMQGCNKHKFTNPEIIEIDTVRNEITVDTIRVINTDTVYKYISIKVPVPYRDTGYVPKETIDNFDDFTIKQPWIYEDTIRDDTMSINYWIRSWGYIDSISVGYRPLAQYYIEEKSVLELEVTKKKRFNGFYMGLDVGIGKDGLTHTAPMMELSTAKVNYNAGFDLMDKSVIFGVRVGINKKHK